MKYNVNNTVKVKLLPLGVKILKDKYDKVSFRLYGENYNITLDNEGYYETQMWDLMQTFGEYMKPGCVLPFDSNIILVD